VCGFACFDEVRNTKAWNDNPLAPNVLYFYPQKEISSYMMGDAVLGGKFPHPMLREFSWLIALQRA
jgi:hypothetical protein